MLKAMEGLVGQVMTVHGPIDAQDMGVTLPHEHLICVHQGPLVDVADHETSSEELRIATRHGIQTVVDMTSIGIGRDPSMIRQVAAESSAQVVMGAGFYKDGWLTPEIRAMSIEEMEGVIVSDLVGGADGTPIRAGVIGEVGVSRSITAAEERSLAASARAQRKTGVAINVHFDIGAQESEYGHAIDILEAEGADLARVVLDHFVCRPDEVELARGLASRGPTIEFDLWGQETWPKIFELTRGTPPEVQIASLRWFILAGLLPHVLISQDIGNLVNQRRHGGYGQAHIVRSLIPRFREFGITEAEIETIMVGNPQRMFPIRTVGA